jgi:hypothetical protein
MTDQTACRLEIPLLAFIKPADPTFFRDRAMVEEYRCRTDAHSPPIRRRAWAYADTRGGPDDRPWHHARARPRFCNWLMT